MIYALKAVMLLKLKVINYWFYSTGIYERTKTLPIYEKEWAQFSKLNEWFVSWKVI